MSNSWKAALQACISRQRDLSQHGLHVQFLEGGSASVTCHSTVYMSNCWKAALQA
ncbi:hypothetical protein DPMN_111208 [Dreissena polymorpha]|uniref:Uncharacterized protein n=1 Tax=Dreissena polymorpha TaxID=45954 RepID=A0A9D4KEG0_DREPO|nr:hypothetical protein DPMN_111208 [Dreissena polymorpha]